jgi:hypothetical protein
MDWEDGWIGRADCLNGVVRLREGSWNGQVCGIDNYLLKRDWDGLI